jgi:hypothetical protein
MGTRKTGRLLGRPTIVGLLAIGMIISSCASNDARMRKSAAMKTAATSTAVTDTTVMQQEKTVKLRYYGGPKSPMYPE